MTVPWLGLPTLYLTLNTWVAPLCKTDYKIYLLFTNVFLKITAKTHTIIRLLVQWLQHFFWPRTTHTPHARMHACTHTHTHTHIHTQICWPYPWGKITASQPCLTSILGCQSPITATLTHNQDVTDRWPAHTMCLKHDTVHMNQACTLWNLSWCHTLHDNATYLLSCNQKVKDWTRNLEFRHAMSYFFVPPSKTWSLYQTNLNLIIQRSLNQDKTKANMACVQSLKHNQRASAVHLQTGGWITLSVNYTPLQPSWPRDDPGLKGRPVIPTLHLPAVKLSWHAPD